MKTESKDLIVTCDMPVMPLVLLDRGVVANVERLADAAKTVTITDAAQANVAGQFLREASGLAADIEKARKAKKAPFFDIGKQIDTAANTEITKLEAGIAALKKKLTAWQVEQDRLAAIEAERVRKEQERLAREAAEAEKARVAAESAAKAAAASSDDDDDLGALGAELEVEQANAVVAQVAAQAVAVAQAPRVIAPAAPAGIHYRTTLKHTVTDVSKLPAALTTITPNDAEIRRLYCQGWTEGDPVPSVPGVTFTIDKQPIARR